MKSIIWAIALASIFSVSNAFAKEETQDYSKYYCQSDQIDITDEAIFVYLPNKTIEVDGLQVDQGGIFFKRDQTRCYNCRRPLNPKNTCEYPDCKK